MTLYENGYRIKNKKHESKQLYREHEMTSKSTYKNTDKESSLAFCVAVFALTSDKLLKRLARREKASLASRYLVGLVTNPDFTKSVAQKND